MARYPFGIPNGWFLLAYSEDLPKGAAERFHYVGRELVGFRGEDGVPHLLDAYCPHLGAHLGVGGRVDGSWLRCPFHHWAYDGSGHCVDIPYAKRIPRQARVRSFPCVERNGMLFFWFHADGKEPFYELPDLPEWHDGDFTSSWVRHEWRVKTHCQEMQENSVDAEHFPSIHRMDMRDVLWHEFRGDVMHWGFRASKAVSTLDGEQDTLRLDAESWGLGYNLVRQQGRFETLVATGLTPIDAETTHMRLGVIGRREGREEAEALAVMRRYMEEHAVVGTEDFHIWEHKLYREKPLLTETEGAIVEFRNWAARFH
jgi:phenylpropionate dioxygenase-like ring-hydroxylating dioxygenase large terminal subunit